jgi:hypothetical protein
VSKTAKQKSELEQAIDLLTEAFNQPNRAAAVGYVDQIGDLLADRLKHREQFNQGLDAAFEDKQTGPEFSTDPDTGRTMAPKGDFLLTKEETEPLPTTSEVSLSGKGLIDTIKRGRKLPGPGGWVRIAEDAPYTGPPMAIGPRDVLVQAADFTLEDLMSALLQKFGPVIPKAYRIRTMTAPLATDEKDRVIDMLAAKVAELETEKQLGSGGTEH